MATKTIANLRIHVEREMERIKNFRILTGVMPITMASQDMCPTHKPLPNAC